MFPRVNALEVVGHGSEAVLDVRTFDGHFASPQLPEDDGLQPKHSTYMIVKTTVEWLIAFALLVMTAPLMLVLAVAVKVTSKGPAIYAQTRLGRYGKTYRIFKFRSMVQNAEAGTGAVWAAKNDARITPLGKILRSTRLDELPQLWNVIRGDMGLIGPRPERPEIVRCIERQVPNYRDRLLVRPGITGLAQMLCPADDPEDADLSGLRRKLAHDLYYVREVGFLVDLRIAVSTPCFFIAAAMDSIRFAMIRRYGHAVHQQMTEAVELREQVA